MRAMLQRISPVLVASVLAGGFVVASAAAPAGAEGTRERRDRLHAARPDAAPVISSFPVVHPDLAVQVAEAELLEHAAGAAWLIEEALRVQAEEEAARRAEEAARRAASGTRAGGVSHGRCNGDVACFLECTRAHESDTAGGYGAVSSGGTYRGAYQFAQPTWDAAVAGAGHGEYAGMPADQAPPEVQDAAAAHLYSEVGNRPWGGRC